MRGTSDARRTSAPPRWRVRITTEQGGYDRPVRAANALQAIALATIVATDETGPDRVVVSAQPWEGE